MPHIRRFTQTIAPFSIIFLLLLALGLSVAHTAVFADESTYQQPSGDKEAEITRLSTQLRTADPEARRDAAMALAHIKDKAVVPVLIGALNDQAPMVRAAVVTALGHLGDSSAVAALVSRLSSDKEVFVRKAAAYALGRLSGNESTIALIAALNDKDPEVRGAAAVSLGEHPDLMTIAPLSTALSDKSDFVRARAAAALGVTGPSAATAVPTLIGLLKSDPDSEVKRHAAAALGSIGDRSALPALHLAAHDTDPYLANAARASIIKLELKK
jgi:HEAT repeat protein